MNLVDLLAEQARSHPARPAICCRGASIGYADLLGRSAALAQRLRAAGLRPGDTVLLVLGVGIPLYVTVLALFRLGAVAVFSEPAAGLRGLRQAARSVAPRALIGDWRRHLLRLAVPELRRIAILASPEAATATATATATVPAQGERPLDLPDGAPALITFTSGSTGRPKGIVRSHGFLLEQHRQVGAVLRPRMDDVVLTSLPVFILSNLAHGVTSVIPDCDLGHPARADPRRLVGQIERSRVNCLVLPPALCSCLAQSGASVPRIRQVFTGGGPVFPDTLRGLARFAPQARITMIYGSSEAEPIAAIALDEICAADFEAMRSGAGLLAGFPVKDIALRIVDHEIRVRGPHVVRGYLDPADDAGTGEEVGRCAWHRTGDAGRIDSKGRLWLLGRREAKCGSLFPFAVEAAARAAPGVRNAALLPAGASTILAIECDPSVPFEVPGKWKELWPEIERILVVARIPMDRKHNSKVDYRRLRALLR